MLRQLAREFVDREMIPLEAGRVDRSILPVAVRADLEAKARDLGLWALDTPEEYGGAGLGVLAKAVVDEQMARSVLLPFRVPGLTGPAIGILAACNAEQRRRYLEPVIRGERQSCFALTEPDAGSDAIGRMRTTAVRQGDDWVINGTKIFITNAELADFVQVMALTDKERRGRGGITCFLVDRGTPGFRIARQLDMMIPERPCELVFENCRVPQSQVLGEVGQGLSLAGEWLTRNRVHHSAKCIGKGQRALELAVEFARQRVTFGRPLADRQAIQWMVADSMLDLEAARLAVYRCAARLDAGADVSQELPMAKVLANEGAYRTADRALQIFGGMGLSNDLPLEQLFRELRSTRITEGTTEIHRWRIARNVLADGRWPEI